MKVLKQFVELGSCGRRSGNGEREATLGPSERASASYELVADGAERAKDEDGGPSRCGATTLGLGAQLQLAPEVVREHCRQHIDLVGDQTLARHVAEAGVLLGLAEDLFLQAAAVEERDDGRGGDGLV